MIINYLRNGWTEHADRSGEIRNAYKILLAGIQRMGAV